jgi:hypothetical protein
MKKNAPVVASSECCSCYGTIEDKNGDEKENTGGNRAIE